MVKGGKKTTSSITKNKDKENPEIYVLLRDIVTNTHQVIQRSQVITSRKIQKLKADDEISYGQRGSRIRAIIVMIGTENQCKNSLLVIEKANVSKNKTNKVTKKNIVEGESETDDINDVGAHDDDAELGKSDGETDDINDVGAHDDDAELGKSDGETDDINDVGANDDDAELGESDEETELNDAEEVDSSNENDIRHIDQEKTSKDIPIPKDTEPTLGTQKRKLSFNNDTEQSLKCSRNSSRGVPTGVHASLQRKVDSLEAQVLEYQTTWIPRPTDQATIDYLIDIGRILSGESNMDADEKSDVLLRVTSTLDVTEQQLAACKGKNIRITVRKIMKMINPDPPIDFKFAQVDREHVAAARDYARLMHPNEEKMYTDGDLNHAMGNFFATKTHKNNFKSSNNK